LGSGDVEVNKALDSVVVQMHGITSDPSTGSAQLGPVLNGKSSIGACRGPVGYWIPSDNYTIGGPFGY